MRWTGAKPWARVSACTAATLALALVPATAGAAEGDAEPSVSPVQVHGFASQGFILTTHNEYLVYKSTHGSFQFSEVGLNATINVTETLRLGAQLFAQDFGHSGNYDVKADWFYLDYHWQDWLGVRFGRLKIPFGLSNEIQDVDAA